MGIGNWAWGMGHGASGIRVVVGCVACDKSSKSIDFSSSDAPDTIYKKACLRQKFWAE
ncbi:MULTISPECIES: hypothetical protein [unclassified Microcoleus]|uniref:hypothetical protein n=1 Tax=unclassified Microcoleus TaxID=2642155 RepID=UPI002FD6637D